MPFAYSVFHLTAKRITHSPLANSTNSEQRMSFNFNPSRPLTSLKDVTNNSVLVCSSEACQPPVFIVS
jgi:hypothetical protein